MTPTTAVNATVTEIISVGNYEDAVLLQHGMMAELGLLPQVWAEEGGRYKLVMLDGNLTPETENQATGFCIGVLWVKGKGTP